jgi:hypothetical protein
VANVEAQPAEHGTSCTSPDEISGLGVDLTPAGVPSVQASDQLRDYEIIHGGRLWVNTSGCSMHSGLRDNAA